MGTAYTSLRDENDNDITNKAVVFDPSLNDVGEGTADYSEPGNAGALYRLYWNVRENYPFDETKTVRVIVQWNEGGLVNTFSLDMLKTDGE